MFVGENTSSQEYHKKGYKPPLPNAVHEVHTHNYQEEAVQFRSNVRRENTSSQEYRRNGYNPPLPRVDLTVFFFFEKILKAG